MANDDISGLRFDLRHLESRVDALQHRIASLESARPQEPAKPVQPAPPPVIVVPPKPPVTFSTVPPPPSEPSFAPPKPRNVPPSAALKPQPAPSGTAAEYKIGAVILPRVGAGVVLVAIGTFVSMAISRGWISQWAQFWMGVMVCLAFIGVGTWKRNEGEEFGQLLIGIGSCGLYLAFAAGHVFLHLFERSVLVELFLGLSLANLVYSYRVASRSFLAIGMIGGLAAAAMPMAENRIALNAALHFAIVIPCAAIVAKHRWSDWAILLWVFAAAALVPADLYGAAWSIRIVDVYGTTLLCAAAYLLAGESSLDPRGLFVAVATVLAALIGMFWIHAGREGALHVAAFGACAFALGRLVKPSNPAALALRVGGAGVVVAIAPWGFDLTQASFVFQALTALCALGVLRFNPKAAVGLAWFEFLLGALAYLLKLGTGTPMPWGVESGLLAAMIAAALIGAWAHSRVQGSPEWIALGACVLAMPVFTRLAVVSLSLSPAGLGIYTALLVGWMLFGFFVNLVAAQTRWLHPTVASWLSLALALAFYIPAAALEPLGGGADSLLLLGLIASTLTSTYVARGFARTDGTESLGLLAAILVLPLFSRLAWVHLTAHGLSGFASLCIAWIAYSLGLCAVTAVTRWKSLCGAAWLVALLAMGAYAQLVATVAVELPSDLTLIFALGSVVAICTWTSCLLDDARPVQELVNCAALIVLPLFCRLAFVVLGQTGIDARTAIAIACIGYSAAACVVSLKLKWDGTAALAGGVALAAGLSYTVAAGGHGLPFGTDVYLVSALLADLGLVWFTLARRGALGFDLPGFTTLAGFVAMPVFSRLSWLLFTHWGASPTAALAFGWTIVSLATAGLVWRTKWGSPNALALVTLLCAVLAYMGGMMDTGFAVAEEQAVLGALLAATLGVTLASCKVGWDRVAVISCAVPAVWAMLSRLSVLILTGSAFDMRMSGAMTLCWSLYALVLVAGGFLGRQPLLRYWSLAVFGTTLAKVVTWDMAALDPALRVGVLMVLGMAMLGVGYWYVRSKGLLDGEGPAIGRRS